MLHKVIEIRLQCRKIQSENAGYAILGLKNAEFPENFFAIIAFG
jgi:hypothetical protein